MGIKKVVVGISFILCALLLVALLLPPKRKIPVLQTEYLCAWENGNTSQESFVSLYPHLITGEKEKLTFLREGVRGEYLTGEDYKAGYTALKEGTLLEMSAYDVSPLPSLERVGLYRAFQHTLFYEGECFRWSGEKLVRTENNRTYELHLVSGSFAEGFLAQSGAEVLTLRENAVITSQDLVGSRVKEINVKPPYCFENGALYDCAQGVLILALAHITHLNVPNEVVRVKEGALSPCKGIESLSLPFVGEREGGFFGEIFALNEYGAFDIPPTLKKLTVRGGSVSALSFYGAEHLEEIDLREVRAERINPDAFVHCTSLKRLYTPVEVNLNVDFTCYERENYFEYVNNL